MANTEHSIPKKEKRSISRRHLVFYLRVFDNVSDEMLGHLADISPRGIMLISETLIKTDREYRLRIKLPKEVSGREEIVFEAVSCWSRRDSNPDYYITGFQINEPDHDLEIQIQELIKDFSREETVKSNESETPACNLTHTTGR